MLQHQPLLAMGAAPGRVQQVQSMTAQRRGVIRLCSAFAGASHKIILYLLFSGVLLTFLMVGT